MICQLKEAGRPKVPITIFLTPLASLRRKPIPFLPNLSNDLVAEAERVVRHVDTVLRRLKKLDGSALAQLSVKYDSSLSKILRHFEQNREDLKKALLTFLPLIDSRSDKLTIARDELVKTMEDSLENKTNVFLNTLEVEAEFVEKYMKAVKDSGLSLARNDAEARMVETRMPQTLDQVVLEVDFASSLPENPMPELISGSLQIKKDALHQDKMTTRLTELSRIQDANKTELGCSVRLNCDQEQNRTGVQLINQQEELKLLPSFTIKDLRIEDFIILGTVDPVDATGHVEVKVEQTTEGIKIHKFAVESDTLRVPLEELGLKPDRKHEVQIRAVSAQGVRGSWLPSDPLKLVLPPGAMSKNF